ALPLERSVETPKIISVAQFHPEKGLQEYMVVISYQFTVCISVVEYMAAGAIPIAHNSAGPKMDIVLDEDGHKQDFLLKM
ncbi:hypothetical protein ES332_A03G056400v1, partial [Gossypium tomentosum]